MSISVLELVGEESRTGPTLVGKRSADFAPKHVQVTWKGQAVLERLRWNSIGEISLACVDLIENSLSRITGTSKIDPSSDLARWNGYWNRKAQSYFEEWATSTNTNDQNDFGRELSRWRALKERFSFVPWVESNRPQRIADPIDQHAAYTVSRRNAGWLSMAGWLLLLISIHSLKPTWPWFRKHSWWCLLGLGSFVWIVSGAWLPLLILGGIGLIVAADSYWIVTSRLRRTGIRGLRSL